MAFWAKIPFSFLLLLLTSTFLSLPVPAFSLQLTIAPTSSVNARTPVTWAPEPADELGQDNSIPPISDETSLFDLRFVNADTEADEGLAAANVDFRVALAREGGRETNEVVFRKPGNFFLRAVSGPSFRTIGTSNVVSVTPASTIKLGPTSTSSVAPGTSPTSTSPSTTLATSSPTNKTPIIVGALIGALLFITLLTLLLLFLLRRRRIQREEEEAISRLSFHPDQMVVPKSAVGGGGGLGVRRQSLAARIWGSFSAAASAVSAATPTVNTNQAGNAENRDLEVGLGSGQVVAVKEGEERRPSDTTSLSNYSSSSTSTLSTTDTDPHAQIHTHPCPSTFPIAFPEPETHTADRELYRARERDLESARASTEHDRERDLEAARESINSVEDLRSPRVLDRSSTSSSGSSSGLGGTNGTGSSALLGVIAFRNPFLVYGRDSDEEEGSGSKAPEMTEVTKSEGRSISIPPAPRTPPPRVPSTSVRVLPSLPAPIPVHAPVPVAQVQRTVRIAELETGRVGAESPKLPPVRISQAGLGLVFSMTSPTATSASAPTATATATTTTTSSATKKTVPPPPPPKKSKSRQPEPTTTQSRPLTPTTSTRTRPLPTPTLPSATYSKPLPAPIPSRPTTPNTARPLPTPGLVVSVPRTPSPPTPGVSGGFNIRALPPVPPSADGGLRSAPIAPPTSAFTARIEGPTTATAGSTNAHRTKRQRYLDLRLSQAQSQLKSLRTKSRRGEIDEGVAKRVIRDLEKQVEWLESGIREGGWAKGERDWMEPEEEVGWRRWMRP